MGWFKKAFHFRTPKIINRIDKSVKKIAKKSGIGSISVDDLLPEASKGFGVDDLVPEMFKSPKTSEAEDTAPPPVIEDPTGNLDPEEAKKIARKRLSRVGKYFTSVLGDTSKAQTGSQKVFS